MPQKSSIRTRSRKASTTPIHDSPDKPTKRKRLYVEVESDRTYSKTKTDAFIAKDYLQGSHLSSFDPDTAQITTALSDILKEAKLQKTLKAFIEECPRMTKTPKLQDFARKYSGIGSENSSDVVSPMDKSSMETSMEEKENINTTSQPSEDIIPILKTAGVLPHCLTERFNALESLFGDELQSNIPMDIFDRLKRLEDKVQETCLLLSK